MPPVETEEEVEKRIKNRQEEAYKKNVDRIKLGRQNSKSDEEKERSVIVRPKHKLKRQKSKSESEKNSNFF